MFQEQQQAIEARVRRWLDTVERVPREAYTFVARPDELPAQARAESMFWAGEVFLQDASPYSEGLAARHAFHHATAETIDLLRHEMSAAGLDLTVIEGRNFGLVAVARESCDLLRIPDEEQRKAEICRVAGLLFRDGAGRPSYCAPVHVKEGSLAGSDPEAEPLLVTDPRVRKETGVHGGGLFFLYYKRVAQLVGFLNARQWFEEAGAPLIRAVKGRSIRGGRVR